MMTPLPEASSLARLTLFPGESSKRSTLGIESPCLTYWARNGGNVNNVLVRNTSTKLFRMVGEGRG